MISISTHVLDTASGSPAAGITVLLHRGGDDAWSQVGSGVTDLDGRVATLAADLEPGTYRLRFATGAYGNRFYPHVDVVVELDAASDHYHVPLLLSPFGYTTYRGT